MESEATTIRSKPRFWCALIFAVIWGGYCAVYGSMLGLGIATDGPGPPTTPDRIGGCAFYLGLAAWAWGTWWTVGRSYVSADGKGVTVRNLYRTTFVPWDDVADLEAVPGRQFAQLRTHSGKRTVLAAVGGLRLSRKGQTLAQEQVAQLEARRP